MKPLTKQTFLVILVLLLVALNIGLVAFMWYTQRPGRPDESPTNTRFLIKELNFDQAQQQQYIELQKQLADSLATIRRNDRQLHDRFFELMHAPAPDSLLVSTTIDSMAYLRGRIEYFTFMHFRQVRAMCDKEQQQKFDKIITEAMRRMGPRPPKGPGANQHQGPPPPGGPDGPPEGQGPPPQ